MQAFEQQLREAGYLAMGDQIVDATLVPAPKQRNTEDKKPAIKAGKSVRQTWRGKPNKAHQKDVDARWTVKIGGGIRYRPDGPPLPQIATPVFDYKSHISIDQRFGFIRKAAVTSAANSDGRQLRRVIDTANTASDICADSAYLSSKNEAWLKANMLKSRIYRRKPKGRPMPEHMARTNAAKSAIRARVEHVFAHQKNPYGLFRLSALPPCSTLGQVWQVSGFAQQMAL
jgi:IS5 family transposase